MKQDVATQEIVEGTPAEYVLA